MQILMIPMIKKNYKVLIKPQFLGSLMTEITLKYDR